MIYGDKRIFIRVLSITGFTTLIVQIALKFYYYTKSHKEIKVVEYEQHLCLGYSFKSSKRVAEWDRVKWLSETSKWFINYLWLYNKNKRAAEWEAVE